MQPARRFLWIQVEDEKRRPDASAIRSHTATHRHRDRRLTNIIRFREYKKQQQSSKGRMPVPARPDISSRAMSPTLTTITQLSSHLPKGSHDLQADRHPHEQGQCSVQSALMQRQTLSTYRFATYVDLQPTSSSPKLTFELDECSHRMVQYLFTDWIPSLYPERVGAIHRQRFFEMVHTDSMACAIFLTYGFGRAAFEQLGEAKQKSSTNNQDNALSRYWSKYKAACLGMMGEILATSWPVFAAKPLYFASISLAGCAFIMNNPDEGCTHLRGAVNMAKALGGFNVLDELELEASLLWDVQIASLTGEKPAIEDAEISPIAEKMLPQVPGWLERACRRLGLLLSSFLSATCTHRRQSDVCHALQRLFEATELINSFSTRSEEDKFNTTLVIRTLFAGYKLCLCAPAGADRENLGPAHDHDHDIDLLESLRLAGLLVINTTHLKATRKVHLFEKLSEDLHVRLRGQGLGMCWKQCPELILWVCFVGAYGSPNLERTDWFTRKIREGTHSLGIDAWNQVRTILKIFPYIDKEFDDRFEEMWNSSRLMS